MHALYFAYGSNMDARLMAERCPGARALGVAQLENWRFVITKRGSASIAPAWGRIVHGVLWRCAPAHVHVLDAYEGVHWGNYRTCRVTVRDEAGRPYRAFTYVANRAPGGRARVDYMLTVVLPAAEAFGLPEDYRRELAGWLPRWPIGEKRRRYRGRRRPLRL